MNIDKIKSLFEQSKGMKKQIENSLNSNKIELDSSIKRLSLLEESQAFLQKVAQDTQSQLKFKIEDIVNLALETVFPNEYKFNINFNVSRGKTDAELLFLSKSSNKEIDPMQASGGGCVDVVSFALRISSYILENNIDNVILLDEPFRFVSKDLIESASEIIKVLSKKLNLQFIIITHIKEMVNVADKIFEIKKNSEGISEVKIID